MHVTVTKEIWCNKIAFHSSIFMVDFAHNFRVMASSTSSMNRCNYLEEVDDRGFSPYRDCFPINMVVLSPKFYKLEKHREMLCIL